MTQNHRILRNATALVTAQVITKVLNIAVSLAVVRWLGPLELGQYAYIIAFCYPFGALADIGLGMLAIREISGDRAREGVVLSSLSRLSLALTCLSFLAMLTLAALLRHDRPTLLGLTIAGLIGPISALTNPYLVALTAREDLHLLALFRVAGSALGSGATLLVILAGGTVLPLLIAAGATGSVMLGVARLLAGPRGQVPRIPAATYRHMLRQTIPFGLVMIGFTLYYRVDMVMLRWLQGAAEVGRYSAAYRFLDAVLVLGHALGGTFYPRLSRLASRDAQAVPSLIEVTFRPMFALGLPLAVGTFCIADPLVLALFGRDFAGAAGPLRILIWGAIPLMLIIIPNHALNAADRVWSLAGVYWLSVALNVLANLFFIPRWGAEGASGATLLCEWVNLAFVVGIIRRAFRCAIPWQGLWRYLLAAGAMAAALWLARGYGLPMEILVGVMTYAAGLVLLGYLRSADFGALRRLLAQ